MGKLNPDGAPKDPVAGLRRRIEKLEAELKRQRSSSTFLQNATIGRRGITVKDGGSITVTGGGGMAIVDGGQTTFTYGDFVSKVLASLGAPNVTVRGLQANTPAGDPIFEAFSDPDISANGQFQVGVPGQANRPYFDVYAINADIEASNGLNMVGGNSAITLSDALGVQMKPGPAGYTLASVPTTAASPNLVLDASTLALARSVSSRRYKQDIADAELDAEALLRLVPRRFRSKAEVAEQGDDAPEHVGFIAEEAADLGLDEFVTSDEDGPESFAYAAYVVGLQAIVRQQAEQITDLTARLERLENATPDE